MISKSLYRYFDVKRFIYLIILVDPGAVAINSVHLLNGGKSRLSNNIIIDWRTVQSPGEQ